MPYYQLSGYRSVAALIAERYFMSLLDQAVHGTKALLGGGVASAHLLANNALLARDMAPHLHGDFVTAATLCNGGMFAAVFGMSFL